MAPMPRRTGGGTVTGDVGEPHTAPAREESPMATTEPTTYAAPGTARQSGRAGRSATTTSSAASGSPPTDRRVPRRTSRPRRASRSARSPTRAPADIELALDAAHAAKDAWGARSPAERAAVLNAIADAIEENLEMLAVAESWENGKPVRETLAADIPLAIDHFRYFAGAVRAEEGRISRDRQGHLRLPLPRAARRGRADHPVQLPAADGGVEDRPGAGGRQLHGASSRPARRRGRS